MNKKIIFLLLLSIVVTSNQVRANNAIATTAALASGIAAGYFSKPIFYHNPDGKSEIAKSWVRKLAVFLKTGRTENKRISDYKDTPIGTEMDNYIFAFRALLGIFSFLTVKVLYK